MLCCNPQDARILAAAWDAGNAAVILSNGAIHIQTPRASGFMVLVGGPAGSLAETALALVCNSATHANSNARQPLPVA